MKKDRKKKLIILTAAFFIGNGIVVCINPITSHATNDIVYSKKDRPSYSPNNTAKLKSYNKKRYQDWSNTFTPDQKKMIQTYKKSSTTNEILKKFRGNISKLKRLAAQSGADPKLKKAVKEIEQMDALIKRPENKTTESQIIYTRFSATDFGFSSDADLSSGILGIDTQKLTNFKKNFQFGKFSDLRLGNIQEEAQGWTGALFSNQRILVELEIPAGKYLAHLDDGQTIFPTDYGMKLTDKNMKIIVQSGKKIIKMKAKVVDKSEIDTEIALQEKALQKVINTSLRAREINEEDIANLNELFLFNFTGLNASFAYQNSQKALLDLVNNPYIPNELLRDGLFKLQKQIGFIFEETPIDMNEETDGVTIIPSDTNEPAFIKINPTPHSILSKFDEHLSTSGTLHHEFGHLIERKILNGIADSEEFKSLFEREKNNVTKINTNSNYAKSSPYEFFAEVFKSMVSMGNENHPSIYYRESIRKEVPETVKFIEGKLREKGYSLKN